METRGRRNGAGKFWEDISSEDLYTPTLKKAWYIS